MAANGTTRTTAKSSATKTSGAKTPGNGKNGTTATRKPAAAKSTARASSGNRRKADAAAQRGPGLVAQGVAFSLGAGLVVAGAALVRALQRGTLKLPEALGGRPSDGHVPTDLLGDEHPGPEDRAIPHFRPDPTAPVAPEDREALRPATGPAPTLVQGQADDLARVDAVPA